jgi:hypothetical protein
MKVALGQSESEEYQVGLAEVADTLKGTVGLLFTELPREKVSLYYLLFYLWLFNQSIQIFNSNTIV